MKDMNASVEPEVKPALSPSRFVKVFMHGKPFGRKINLAVHNSYDSLSFTLKRLGNNYSMSPFELKGLVNNEENGAVDDNDFDLLYDDNDGVRFFLGEVPWEVFATSVKRIYIVPIEEQNENDEYQEEEEDNSAAAADNDGAAADEDGDGDAADDGAAAAVDDGEDHGYTSNDDPSFN
uniref:Auxin-responsive protein n=1 Tax=Leersia perrieri TaxID=77586 RepID=A0A0D9XQF4_9ORYZ